ncbi:leucine-rich repeat domain-containing protein [Pseudoteredinibacter isoporae]|uniref:Leucine-rich repeat (LRR) protein n=1 Tax=Pseudoteredinibacter isoporae TaxID=570281 RepID=A0A7X0MXF5_9GAMM|nr:leucine-rich repeat domain-containing protein [Pseudoteredinibacter isoporae]MBB6523443.1 Leucine-rich repeat (LRR) protein [Pseudoteredinibacter isoporae]NHO88952.1 hypothetical protein [Pseudoteredinibacter isoporae]NIB24340.1 hypothetical protein [Pseudoteredinibacter isoporae]
MAAGTWMLTMDCENKNSYFSFIFSIFLFSFSLSSFALENSVCNDDAYVLKGDCEALVSLYNALDGDSWSPNNWSSDPVSRWSGVVVDENKRVVSLKLHNIGASGSLPASLGDLPELKVLVLAQGSITGTLPDEMANLQKLEYLWLFGNQLTGDLPGFLGTFTELRHLYLQGNQFTGSIPSYVFELPNLEQLHLSRNNFSAGLPASVGQNKNLDSLGLSGVDISGPFPTSLLALTKLKLLDMTGTGLTGPIPEEISQLLELKSLSLAENQLTGSLPAGLFQLSKLEQLLLSENQLSGHVPSEIASLQALKWLALGGNQFSGEIPNEVGELSQLERLELQDNQFTGLFPKSIAELPFLAIIDTRNNNFIGDIYALFDGVILAELNIDDKNNGSLQTIISFAKLGEGRFLLPDNDYVDGGTLFAAAGEGFRLSEFNGCSGEKTGFAYTIGAQTSSCTIEATFEACDDTTIGDCINDLGTTDVNGEAVANTQLNAINNSTAYLLGNVMMLQGWLYEPEINKHYPGREVSITLNQGGEFSVPLRYEDPRLPVELKTLNNGPVYWAVFADAETIRSHDIRVKVRTKEGVLVNEAELKSLAVDNRIDQSGAFSSITNTVLIEDFPQADFDIRLKFNAEAQRFVLVDQLDASGQSMLSSNKYFTDDGKSVEALPKLNGQDAVGLDNHIIDGVLSGIVPLTGWYSTELPDLQGKELLIQIDDATPEAVQNFTRNSVNQRLGLSATAETAWGYYLNTLNLDNGDHRLRLIVDDRIFWEASFKSHSLLNASAQAMYVSPSTQETTVMDVPASGDSLKLRFDANMQNFVVIEQTLVSP